jgi:hypothetical protein
VLVEILNVRQVAECLVLDGASLSVTALQQVGAIDLVLVLARVVVTTRAVPVRAAMAAIYKQGA